MKKDKTIPPYMDYEIKQEIPICWVQENENEYKIIIAEDFELKENNGEWFAVCKKPQYPKTYKECSKELGYNQVMPTDHILGYRGTLLSLFQQLLICRDAYWKIAGDEMELGKPWKPDWKDSNFKYCLKKMGDNIERLSEMTISCILTFPTEEMRDAFFENFKDLIEECKELL